MTPFVVIISLFIYFIIPSGINTQTVSTYYYIVDQSVGLTQTSYKYFLLKLNIEIHHYYTQCLPPFGICVNL